MIRTTKDFKLNIKNRNMTTNDKNKNDIITYNIRILIDNTTTSFKMNPDAIELVSKFYEHYYTKLNTEDLNNIYVIKIKIQNIIPNQIKTTIKNLKTISLKQKESLNKFADKIESLFANEDSNFDLLEPKDTAILNKDFKNIGLKFKQIIDKYDVKNEKEEELIIMDIDAFGEQINKLFIYPIQYNTKMNTFCEIEIENIEIGHIRFDKNTEKNKTKKNFYKQDFYKQDLIYVKTNVDDLHIKMKQAFISDEIMQKKNVNPVIKKLPFLIEKEEVQIDNLDWKNDINMEYIAIQWYYLITEYNIKKIMGEEKYMERLILGTDNNRTSLRDNLSRIDELIRDEYNQLQSKNSDKSLLLSEKIDKIFPKRTIALKKLKKLVIKFNGLDKKANKLSRIYKKLIGYQLTIEQLSTFFMEFTQTMNKDYFDYHTQLRLFNKFDALQKAGIYKRLKLKSRKDITEMIKFLNIMNNLKITNLTMINTTIFNIRGSKLMHSNITSLLVSVTRSSIILFHIPYVIINRRYYPGGSGLPGSSGAGKTPKIPSSSSSESKVPQTPYKNQDLQDGVKSWTKPIDSPYVPPSYVPTQIPTQSSPQLSPTITKGEPKTSSSSAKINEPYYDIKKTMETAQIHQSLPETSVPKTGTQLGSNLDQNPPSHSSDHTPPLLTSPSKTSTIVAPAPTLPHIAKREYAVRTVNKPDKSSPNPQAIKNNPPFAASGNSSSKVYFSWM